MMKKTTLLLSSFLLTCSAFAESIQLPKYIETTNIDTEGYVWKFTVHTTGLKDPDVELRLQNPHPNLTVYNQRANQIAEEYNFQRAISNAITNKQTFINPDDFETYEELINQVKINNLNLDFDLPLEFKQGIQVNSKRMSMFKLRACPRQSTSYDTKIELTMKGDGKVLSVYVDNQELPSYVETEIVRGFKRSKVVYPYNENGVLVDKYKVTIPLNVICK